LCGDALALGGHYEYDAKKLFDKVGEYKTFTEPGRDNNGIGWGTANYHPGKKAGDLTDAGDIAIMLLEYVAKNKTYDFDGFADYWYEQIRNGYGSCNFQSVGRDATECPPGTKPGYINGASRRTLQALQQMGTAGVKGDKRKQIAADVNCLVSATHFLPLFLIMHDEPRLVESCVSTVYLSHKNRDPVKAAEFLARTLYRIIHLDYSLEDALDDAAIATRDAFISDRLSDAKAKVKESVDPSSPLSREQFVDDLALTSMARLWEIGKSEPIKVGKASPTEGALPGSLYLAIKYQHSLSEALIANAGIGGDSAARGIVIGMLLGAIHGQEGLPKVWLESLNSLPHVTSLFEAIRQREDQDETQKSCSSSDADGAASTGVM
jgi:ADP-ribosylglycohydrolase